MNAARPALADKSTEFAAVFFALSIAALALAVTAPITFSIATVFLFAGPHNWIEARYFLSRLPARYGKYRSFFVWSFCGIAVLMASYTGLLTLLHMKLLADTVGSALLGAWNASFIFWIVRLTQLSGAWKAGCDRELALPFGFLALSFALAFPGWFALSLVYLHPFIGCWILDRELARSKPHWRQTYHTCLLSIPVFIVAIWATLHSAPSLTSNEMLTLQITKHAGADVFPFASSHMLVAMHTFLEFIHYGVWLIAIPLVSAGWRNWQPVSIPLVHRAPVFKRIVPATLGLSTFAVVVIWVCFILNYSITRDVYFTLAMAHVLAEIPFLLKTIS